MPTVVISSYDVANFPEGGGHLWVYMQYAQGLRQVGCDVYWMENFRRSNDEQRDAAALETFRARIEQFGLGGKLILYVSQGHAVIPPLPSAYVGMTQAAKRYGKMRMFLLRRRAAPEPYAI